MRLANQDAAQTTKTHLSTSLSMLGRLRIICFMLHACMSTQGGDADVCAGSFHDDADHALFPHRWPVREDMSAHDRPHYLQ